MSRKSAFYTVIFILLAICIIILVVLALKP
jgi:hypothetical protein